MAAAKENDYAFFKNFKEYRESIKKLQNGTLSSLEDKKCNSIRKDDRFLLLNNSEEICKDFKILSNSMLSFGHDISGDSTRHISDFGFLNYWLNDNLRNYGANGSNYVKEFYYKLKEDNDFDTKNLLNDKIYDIDELDFKKLRFLYNLYDNLYKIIDIIDDKPVLRGFPCSYYTSICIENYREAKILGNDESSFFWGALNDFKNSYITIPYDPEDDKGCNFSTSGKLPTDEEILSYRSIVFGGKRPWTKDKIRKLIKGGSNKNEWENQLIHSDIEKKKVHLDKDKYNIEYRSAGNF
ncbi:unnamed protein product [Plasmodium vivax]|uniref:(malaria parasite P. vivax) hypothetical protein n=1 Tax=Plasmodium vivax TaxID=5855 RepID=A0A8S4HM44_PLAVI|nr:unnamed protein product [Plasmodium vivax]